MAAAKTLTRKQRATRARMAAYARWAAEDPAETGIRGQRGLRAKFDREVREATPGLSEAEYERRAGSAYRAHMSRVAYASSRARARKAAAGAT